MIQSTQVTKTELLKKVFPTVGASLEILFDSKMGFYDLQRASKFASTNFTCSRLTLDCWRARRPLQ